MLWLNQFKKRVLYLVEDHNAIVVKMKILFDEFNALIIPVQNDPAYTVQIYQMTKVTCSLHLIKLMGLWWQVNYERWSLAS